MICDAPSLSRYKGGACRCEGCRAANVTYMREYHKRRIITGQPELVDASRAREHLLFLIEQGIGYRKAARLAGLAEGSTHTRRIATGVTQRIHRATERAVLAVRP